MGSTGEWVEPDGLGGFAMGTVSGLRTRRYHGLLLSARRPPSDRVRLVSGVEVWVETRAGTFALSSQRYGESTVHPDGLSRVVRSGLVPWPHWVFALPDGTQIEHDLFVPHERAAVMLGWRRLSGDPDARLFVRPLLACRDFHALSQENTVLDPRPVVEGGRVAWRPYTHMPEVVAIADGRYEHDPNWYRHFAYDDERARGLDAEEDLWSPGVFSSRLHDPGVAIGFTTRELEPALAHDGRRAAVIRSELADGERKRRASFSTPLARAADAYVVRRGEGKTIIAGYPWFGDWGRDTFISLRGLCLGAGRFDDAAAILSAWAPFVSGGMLPNRFPDGGDEPEYNSVDAALWYVVAVREYLAATRSLAKHRETLERAVLAIVVGHVEGTRHGIAVDPSDGLLRAGEPGQQLTWMDARCDGREVTPRIGKPVEVNALWLNVLDFARVLDPGRNALFAQALASFRARFPIDGRLADVIDVDHRGGAIDASLRPNQVLAIGGLPFVPIEGELARTVLETVERALWTPMGLRSLGPSEPGYVGHYEGGPSARDACYHQGTVWPWMTAAFVDAWLRVHGDEPGARAEARCRFVAPLEAHLAAAGIGHVSEIADGDAPHTPRGCPFQAWSVGSLIQARVLVEPAG
jgi:predicted glycogen debranching enzyme